MAVLDRVPVTDIKTRAAEIAPARVALAILKMTLAVLAFPFLMVGWVARMTVRATGAIVKALWVVASYAFAAVQVGWAQAAPRARDAGGS